MAGMQMTVKSEREKKLVSVLVFATSLSKRIEKSHDASLPADIHAQIRGLPLQPSSAISAKKSELDKRGTELWNLSTHMRRGEADALATEKEDATQKTRTFSLLRAFAFLLLETAARQDTRGRQRKSCVRLMKVALKAAKACIDSGELGIATKVLESAAEYQEKMMKPNGSAVSGETELTDRLCLEYFAMRITLAWRQERMDTAEHMFSKCRELIKHPVPATAEVLGDLLYEIGKEALSKNSYDLAIRWLERAYDVLGDRNLEMHNLEVSELRLSTMQSIAQAYMKLRTPEAQEKAWDMMRLMDTDFGDKMAVLLLKIEMLSTVEPTDSNEFYNVLLRMIRTIVLNNTNYKTIMHHIHKLKDQEYVHLDQDHTADILIEYFSSNIACRALDDLIELRLFREENQNWIEKAVITRVWIGTTKDCTENTLENFQALFDSVGQSLKASLTAPATHAAQTLIWKRAEVAIAQEQFDVAEKWGRLCLHTIFEKAGAQNKAKIGRKIMQCSLSRQDYVAVRNAYNQMSDTSKDEPVTRYLMYQAALRCEDLESTADCLGVVCRSSAKDATLLYACVMEAQSMGDKRQAINILEQVIATYENTAPACIHLPALLRCTARLLQSELVKNGEMNGNIMVQLCKLFEGACSQAKASRRRPSTPAQQLFTVKEFEWFSKNAYNMSLKYCTKMAPSILAKLLDACTEFIKLIKEQSQSDAEDDICLRLVFCGFLAACTYTTLARAEDNIQQCLQYYLEARKRSKEFQQAVADGIDKLGGSAQADIISKHFQIVKLELEAVLKLEKWDELDDLFEQCWKYKSPDHYETLADLVLVIHSCVVGAGLDVKYERKILSVLHKIIDLTCRQAGNDLTKLSRWLRCLFNLSLNFDEKTSLKCIEQVTHVAAKRQGDVDRYPQTELEWLATTTYNRAIDYYMQEDDEKCKLWAEKSFVIAQWLDDGGAVRNLLMERFSGLQWDSK